MKIYLAQIKADFWGMVESSAFTSKRMAVDFLTEKAKEIETKSYNLDVEKFRRSIDSRGVYGDWGCAAHVYYLRELELQEER